jgi:hypothetical protein
MFTPFEMAEFVLVVVCLVVSVMLYAFFFSSLRWAKRRRAEDFRCPGCDFLVNIADVKQYGYVCPDCRTDWRVHPLKNDEEEEVEVNREEGAGAEELQSTDGRKKRLVR